MVLWICEAIYWSVIVSSRWSFPYIDWVFKGWFPYVCLLIRLLSGASTHGSKSTTLITCLLKRHQNGLTWGNGYSSLLSCSNYSKSRLKRPLSKRPIFFQDQISLNGGRKYCRMLQGEHSAPLEHSAILSTFIKLPFVIKTIVLSIL